MFRPRASWVLLVLASVLLPAGLCLAGDEKDSPPIRRGISSESYMFMSFMHNAERDFLDPCWERVVTTFEQSGIIEEIAGEADAKNARQIIDQYWSLIDAVDWSAFVSDELVYGINAGYPNHSHTVLARMQPEIAASNYKALRALFEALASLDEHLKIAEWTHGPAKALTLEIEGTRRIVGPTIALAGPVIVFSTDRGNVETALGLVFGGETDALPMVETRGFKKAIALLPTANDSIFYIEPRTIFSSFEGVAEMEKMNLNIGADRFNINRLFHLIDEFVILFEQVAATGWTVDQRTYEATVEIYKEGWREQPLAFLSKDRKGIENFERFVPLNAVSFSISEGAEPANFYDMAEEALRTIAPRTAGQIVPLWEMIQQQIGFHLRNDLLRTIDGSYVNVSFPAIRPSQFSSSDSVVLLGLKDSESLEALVVHGLGIAENILAAASDPAARERDPFAEALSRTNFRIRFIPVEIEGLREGRRIFLSVFPFVQPLFGFYEDYFVLASSEAGLRTYLEFLAGDKPNILENEDFKAIGLEIPERVASISFDDLGASIEGFSQILSMSSMLVMMIPEEDEEARIIKRIFGLGPYLVSVVDAIDFFGYELSYSTFDEEAGIGRTMTVVTYRLDDEK